MAVKELHISIIDEHNAELIYNLLHCLKNGDSVNLNISSLGGSMMHVFEMYEHMNRNSLNMNVANIGIITSGVYFLAHDFKKIRITKWGEIHFVESSIVTIEKESKIIDSYRSILREMDKKIINAFAKKSGKSVKSISKLMEHNSKLSSKDALLWGFVDEIIA